MSVVTQSFPLVVNHLLAREPWAHAQLAPFMGKRARIHLPPFTVAFSVGATGFIEDAGPLPDAAVCDVTITVKAEALTAWIGGGRAALMKQVRIEGDAEFAAVLGKLVDHLRWEPEADLARLVGDIPAYRIAQSGRSLLSRISDAANGLVGSVTEYFLDEQPQWVRHGAMEDFAVEVQALRERLDRLDKRVGLIEHAAGAVDRSGAPGMPGACP